VRFERVLARPVAGVEQGGGVLEVAAATPRQRRADAVQVRGGQRRRQPSAAVPLTDQRLAHNAIVDNFAVFHFISFHLAQNLTFTAIRSQTVTIRAELDSNNATNLTDNSP